MNKKRHEGMWSATHPLDFQKYRGEYIALEGGRIIAHGRDFSKVYKEAIKATTRPIFSKIPEQEVMIL